MIVLYQLSLVYIISDIFVNIVRIYRALRVFSRNSPVDLCFPCKHFPFRLFSEFTARNRAEALAM